MSLVAIVAAIPIVGVLSLVVEVSIAAMAISEITTIIAVSFIGLELVIVVYKHYEEVNFSIDSPRLKLRKK